MKRRSFLTSSSLGATRMALSQGIGSAAMQTRTCLGSRIVDSGGGYCSQNVMPVHFGLPKEGPVDVEVTSLTLSGRKVTRVAAVLSAQMASPVLEVRVP